MAEPPRFWEGRLRKLLEGPTISGDSPSHGISTSGAEKRRQFMTRRETDIRKRAWLKMKVFCVTVSLKGKMEADGSLTEEQKEWLAYIQNKVLIEGRKNPTKWANVGARYFLDKIGGGYRRWIERLVSWDELEENAAYKADGGAGFTKSYRVPPQAIGTGTTKLVFTKKQARPPRAQPTTIPPSKAFGWALTNLKRLSVSESLLRGPDAITEAMVHEFCWRIFFGDFDLRYGPNCRRLYHAVIDMAKEGRANLRLNDSTAPLFEYDVKSCHPVLLLALFTDDEEKRRYGQLLDVDAYDGVAAVMQKELPRDDVKEDFMEALNSSNRAAASLQRKWVYRFFRQEFPIFTREVLDVRSDLAIYCQNLEADLLVEELGGFCSQRGLFWIPCHDGWMTTADHEIEIAEKVREIIWNKVGYSVAVSKVDLVSRASKLLPSHSGSYVTVTPTCSDQTALEKVGDQPPSAPNPWKEVVEKWNRERDPAKTQEASIKRAERRDRQKVAGRRRTKDKRDSDVLAAKARKVMEETGGGATTSVTPSPATDTP